MENFEFVFNPAVRLMLAVYVFHKLWNFLHSEKVTGLWGFLFTKESAGKPKAVKAGKPETAGYDSIVGKSKTIYLKTEKPPDEPAESVPGVDTGYIGEEPGINPDDVECSTGNNDAVPDDEELFMPFDDGEVDEKYDEGFSTGLTFSEIANVVDVVKGKNKNEADKVKAARILYNARNTDMVDFITTQVSGAEAVEKLLKENLDLDGMPLKNKRKLLTPVDDFDINAFVD